MSPLRLIAALPLLLAGGCKCGADKPYTPFSVGDAAAAAAGEPAASAPSVPEAGAPPPAFAGKPAARAPAGATRWQIDGMTLSAPPDRSFERGLAADFDGDGKLEAVTWTLPLPGARAGAPGELWLHPSSGEPRRLAALPGFVPAGPGCRHEPALAQTGPKSVTLDVTASCDAPLLARSPRRAVVVIAPLAPRPIVLALRVAEPAPGEKLTLKVDSTDRDGDGRDDARVDVEVGRADAKGGAAAQLVWLDRAAGVSRDASEPAGSIGRVASLALSRAKSKKTAETVPALVESTRRLMSSLCAESGVPRVFDADGNPLSCGKLGVVVDRLALGELRAALTRGDVLEAFGALARDGWYFGRASDKTAKEMRAALEKSCKPIDAKPRTLELRPLPRSDAPRFSPLEFDASGALSVLTATGTLRVAADGSETPDEDAAAPRTSLEVRSDAGVVWTGVAHACDRNELLLTTSAGPIPTTLLAARPGPCRGAAPRMPAPQPLASKPHGVEVLIALAHEGPKTSLAEAVLRPRVPGTPRSPDGRRLVAPTPIGILVIGGDKPELWRADGLPEWTALSDCAVANDARALACIATGRVLWVQRP